MNLTNEINPDSRWTNSFFYISIVSRQWKSKFYASTPGHHPNVIGWNVPCFMIHATFYEASLILGFSTVYCIAGDGKA